TLTHDGKGSLTTHTLLRPRVTRSENAHARRVYSGPHRCRRRTDAAPDRKTAPPRCIATHRPTSSATDLQREPTKWPTRADSVHNDANVADTQSRGSPVETRR